MVKKRYTFIYWVLMIPFLIDCSQLPKELYQLSNDARPFVTYRLNESSQLGNQLYYIATTLAYAWDNGMDAMFPDLMRDDCNIPMNRERVFFRLNASPLPRPVKNKFASWKLFLKKMIPIKPDMELSGCMQMWKYFHHHQDKIVDIFAPRPAELVYLQNKHSELLAHPLTVGVHVRTFNRTTSKKLPFVGLKYYENAFNLFPQEALFVIFSDRINWCKNHFKKFNRSMVFVEGDYIQDFYLMSMLKNNIIGNSSFSWWAAYLNKNSHKIVVAPSHFISQSRTKNATHANLPNWITLSSNPNHKNDPYPEDIYDYDAISQSLDTQKE